MTKYKKAPASQPPVAAILAPQQPVLGMLYIVEVKMVSPDTRERIKHKLLVVGGEQQDIERKVRWMFDASAHKSLSITSIEKVREKMHILQTVITQDDSPAGPVIAVGERTQSVAQGQTAQEQYDPHLYAIGVTTTMLAKDEEHALRKVGRALIARATPGQSHTAASLSDDSQVQIAHIPKSSGYAMPRDVSSESNMAQIVRG